MNPITADAISEYLQQRIIRFHKGKMDVLMHANLRQLVRRINPYLLQIRQVESIDHFVRVLLDDHLRMIEEDMFGDLLRDTAIHITAMVREAQLHPFPGIDLTFVENGERVLLTVKASPVWKSAYQRSHIRAQFYYAQQSIEKNEPTLNTRCILGVCYGNRIYRDRYNYETLLGQTFWEYISGNPRLYIDLLEPMHHKLDAHSMQYEYNYLQLSAQLARDMLQEFCTNDQLDWDKVLAFCSGTRRTR